MLLKIFHIRQWVSLIINRKLLERYTFEELDYVVKDHTFLK